MKRISVVGLGYIGLPTAIQAAIGGFSVFGFDIDQEKVKNINAGNPTISEPELIERLWKTLKSGNFKAFTDLQYADCFIIAVPTPLKDNNVAELRYVFHAAESIAKRLMPGNLVILESTVPVGTTEKLAIFLEENSGLKIGIDFFVAYCPERVLPGRIFKEIVENDRVVGGICQRSGQLAHQFYSKFVKGFIHITDDKTAEMVKLVENTSRDVQIAFANQVAAMCQKTGIDPYYLIDLANKHPRVKVLTPTCGVGGHCIAIDPWFLIEQFPDDSDLLRTARKINDAKPYQIVQRVINKIGELKALGIEKPKIFALGLTFKPDVDDLRESPALTIVQTLAQKSDICSLTVYDYNVSKATTTALSLIQTDDLWQGFSWADIILILVKHKKFTLLYEEAFGNKVVIDVCGLLHEIHDRQSQDMLEGAIKTRADFLE